MVSKLKFKGDKPKPKRKRGGDERAKDAKDAKDGKRTKADTANSDVGWVTAASSLDLQGPVMITFPSHDEDSRPYCVCSDAMGKVYTSSELDVVKAEDVDKPIHATEPNSVQQVFVLSPVPGSQSTFALKTASGTYLSCDKFGLVDAKARAVGPAETFVLSKTEGGWYLQTKFDRYLSVKRTKDEDDYQVRGDSDQVTLCETFVLRIQAKYQHKERQEHHSTKISSKRLKGMAGTDLSDADISHLKRAHANGKLNEALLDFRQKKKSDTRC